MKVERYFLIVWGLLLTISCSLFFQIVAAKIRQDNQLANRQQNPNSEYNNDLSSSENQNLNNIPRERIHDGGIDSKGVRSNYHGDHLLSPNKLQRHPSFEALLPAVDGDTGHSVGSNQPYGHGQDVNLSSRGILSIVNAFQQIHIPLSDVRSLDLSNNSIKDIPSGAFRNLSQLRFIDLSNNLIESWERKVAGAITDGQDLPHLQKVSLENNKLHHLPFLGFDDSKHFIQKPIFNLTGNPIVCDKEMYSRIFQNDITNEAVRFTGVYCTSPFLQRPTSLFDASYKVKIDKTLFGTKDEYHPCPKGCLCSIRTVDGRHYTKCNGKDTNDENTVPPDIWNGTNVLELTDFHIGKLQKSSPIFNLGYLEELHAKDIYVTQVEDGFFANLVKLKVIDLSENSLRFITPFTFSDVRSLQTLRLDENRIKNVTKCSFDGLTNLLNLTLDNNKFNTLPIDLFDFNKQLAYLTLHDNKIDFLPKNMFENNTALEYLTLPEQWHCNCSNLWLKDWLEEEDCPVEDKEDLTCILNEKPMVKTSDDYYKNRCNIPHEKLTLPTAAAAIAFVLICIIVLHKRDLILLTIYTHTGYRMCDRQNKQQDEGRPFDAFIVYAQQDFDFAFYTLYQKLRSSYRICFNEVNFIPNVTLAENVINAVCCSKRVILVLSSHFVSDEYCALAFTTAHQENMRDHVNRIIVVQMERIEPSTLDQDLRVYLSRTTKSKILKDNRLFWQKLHYRMPDVTPRQSDSESDSRNPSVCRSLILDIEPNDTQPLLSPESNDDDNDELCILDPRYESERASSSDINSSNSCLNPDPHLSQTVQGELNGDNQILISFEEDIELKGSPFDTGLRLETRGAANHTDMQSAEVAGVWTPISRVCLGGWPLQSQESAEDTREQSFVALETCEENDLNDDYDEMPKIKGKLTLLPLL